MKTCVGVCRVDPRRIAGVERGRSNREIGAGRYQRVEGRSTQRNGQRPKTVSTTAGDVEVQIPKLRSGSFFAALLDALVIVHLLVI